MTTYRTLQGDMLDAICKAELGSEARVAEVLDMNQGLAALGPVYPVGVLIALPEPAPTTAPPVTRGEIRLWGRT
jgi:phage tail protein X